MNTDTNTDSGDGESYPDHLAVGRFDHPVTFRVTTDPEGGDTLLPAEIDIDIFAEEFGLSASEYDVAATGLPDDQRFWRHYVFERDAVEDAESVIERVQERIDRYNEPPEGLPEEQRAEWRKATVILTDVRGVEEDIQPDDTSSEGTNHVGPVTFSDETARRQLQQHGHAVTFRTDDRTTGETWWHKSRLGEKMGDCTIEKIAEGIDPSDRDQLKEYWVDSGFATVEDWQEAIRELNDDLSVGYLYRVEIPDRWGECESCHEYSPEVEPVGPRTNHTFLCPDCRSSQWDHSEGEETE